MRKVVLVCGIAGEDPTDLLLDALRIRGADFLFLNQRELAGSVALRWQLSDRGLEGSIRVEDEIVSLEQISSAYVRLVPVTLMPEFSDQPRRAREIRSIMHSLIDLFDLLPGRIVNRRRPMMSNNSKPYQALLIRECGFSIPSTFITNAPRALEECALSRKAMIYKSMSSVRSIVRTASCDDGERIEKLRLLPTQFQEKIEGYCIRVHVIGKIAIATRIHSDATDYRYSQLEDTDSVLAPLELNTELTEKCVSLAKRLELNFSGIDLMVSEDRVVCLEVNPCPGYSYYQKATGQPISGVLADFLMFEESSAAVGSSDSGS